MKNINRDYKKNSIKNTQNSSRISRKALCVASRALQHKEQTVQVSDTTMNNSSITAAS